MPCAESADAVAEMVAAVDARLTAAVAKLGVGVLVATLRPDSCVGFAALLEYVGVMDGFTEPAAGLVVVFASLPSSVER
jgi:hypothetical protein